ncbi:MFS transporter [Kitasatospora sp. P5_F3]
MPSPSAPSLSAPRTAPAPPLAPSVAFWRYWAASTVSNTGSAVTVIALPLIALTVLDATALQVTLLAAAGQISWLLLSLPAGVVAQRIELRRLQVTLDLLRFVALGSIPLAWWLGGLGYSHLLLAALVTGAATVLYDIANSTFLPAVVPPGQLTARNSLMSGTHAVTQTAGPSAGGLLVQAAGPVGALLADAASYLTSALVLRTLPATRPAERPKESTARLIAEGWRYVTRHPVMLPCMLWATATNFVCAGFAALTPLYLVREAGLPPALLGLVIAADGLGALAGAALAPWVSRRLGTARALLASTVTSLLFLFLVPLTTDTGNVYWFALGSFGFGLGIVIGSITTRTHRQTDSPPELLSRVMATVRFVSWGVQPLGALTAGVLATAADPRSALWVICATALLPPVVLLLSPVARRRNLS